MPTESGQTKHKSKMNWAQNETLRNTTTRRCRFRLVRVNVNSKCSIQQIWSEPLIYMHQELTLDMKWIRHECRGCDLKKSTGQKVMNRTRDKDSSGVDQHALGTGLTDGTYLVTAWSHLILKDRPGRCLYRRWWENTWWGVDGWGSWAGLGLKNVTV